MTMSSVVQDISNLTFRNLNVSAAQLSNLQTKMQTVVTGLVNSTDPILRESGQKIVNEDIKINVFDSSPGSGSFSEPYVSSPNSGAEFRWNSGDSALN